MMENQNELSVHDQILKIIQDGSPKHLQDDLNEFHPSDIAEVFETLDEEQQTFMLTYLNPHVLSEIFEHLDEDDAANYIKKVETQKGVFILEDMNPDDAADILGEMRDVDVQDYLENMNQETREALSSLSLHKEDTAGAIMTTDYIELKKGIDVKDAMKELIANAKSTEGIQRLFVVDSYDFLEGVIDLKKLIQARSPKSIDELMYTDVITAKVTDSAESAARMMQNYGIYLLPVVNDRNQLQGVITMDDAADILDEATDEDYARFATISSEADVNISVWKSALHRLPWLTLLLLMGLLISSIISRFENTIERITVLMFFQPLILDMAGNTGTQSLAVTVRALSKDYFKDRKTRVTHVLKELRVGILNGVAIGIVSFFTTFLFLTIMNVNLNYGTPVTIAATVGTSAAIALSFAAAFGAFFPLFLFHIKIDPAVASGPFITTLNDIIGLLIYFGIATVFLLQGVM